MNMKRLLIVVDYQNDFVCGSLGFDKAKELEKGILEKIAEYQNDEIIYTLDTHFDDYLTTAEESTIISEFGQADFAITAFESTHMLLTSPQSYIVLKSLPSRYFAISSDGNVFFSKHSLPFKASANPP